MIVGGTECFTKLTRRGLQGSYNASTSKRNIRVPNGDVIVFSFAYVVLRSPSNSPDWPAVALKLCIHFSYVLTRYPDHIKAGA